MKKHVSFIIDSECQGLQPQLHSNFSFRAPIVAGLTLLVAASMSLGADNPKTLSLLNGKDLTGWKSVGRGTNQWTFGKAAIDPEAPGKLKVVGSGSELISTNRNVNLTSEALFGDCLLEMEFMVGKATLGSDTDSNSGVKLMNIYEVQIFDSSAKATLGKTDCAAIYSETPPLLNACKKPGEWQKLVIDFRAPRFDAAGNKTANAQFAQVTLNGQVVHKNVEIAHGTNVSRNAKEHPTGPIFLQGDHGSVAFRNIRVTRLD